MTRRWVFRTPTWCLLMALTACVPLGGKVVPPPDGTPSPPPVTMDRVVSVPADQPVASGTTGPMTLYDRTRPTTLTVVTDDGLDGSTTTEMQLNVPFLVNRSFQPDATSLSPDILESGGAYMNGNIGLFEPDATASDVQVNGVAMRPWRLQFGGTRSPGNYVYDIKALGTAPQRISATIPATPVRGRSTVAISSLTDPGATISWSAATGHTSYRLDVRGANMQSPPPRSNGYLAAMATLRLSPDTTSLRVGQDAMGADGTRVQLPAEILDARGDRLKADWFYAFQVTAIAEQRAANEDRIVFERPGPALNRP